MAASFSQTFPMEVQLAGSRNAPRRQGVLYGSVPGRFLIAGGFEEGEYSEGDELIVKTTVGGHVIGFWAKVESRIDVKERLYLLSYPEQVEQIEFRETDRVNVMIPAEISIYSGMEGRSKSVKFEGVLLNLSDKGCCLSSKGDWPNDMHCELKFALPGGGDTFALSGQVIRMNREGERLAKIGVQFFDGKESSSIMKDLQDWLTEKRAFLFS